MTDKFLPPIIQCSYFDLIPLAIFLAVQTARFERFNLLSPIIDFLGICFHEPSVKFPEGIIRFYRETGMWRSFDAYLGSN
jgi:hypothetical protein